MAKPKKSKTVARIILEHQMRMAERRAAKRRAEREKNHPPMHSRLFDPGVLKGELR